MKHVLLFFSLNNFHSTLSFMLKCFNCSFLCVVKWAMWIKTKYVWKKPFDYSQELFALSLCVMSISDDDDDCGRLSNGMISVRQVQSNRIQREKKKLKFNQIRNLTVVSIPHNWLLLFLMSQSTSCGHSLNFWYFCVWSFFIAVRSIEMESKMQTIWHH